MKTKRQPQWVPSVAERQKALRSWVDLNAYLRKLTDPLYAKDLLQREKAGANRPTFVTRIHARFNRLRALAERRSLLI